MEKHVENLIRYSQAILLLVIALNAFGGGWYGMAGAEGVPVDWLKNSPFDSYFIPSLILFCLVGGSALVASIGIFFKRRWGRKAAFCSATITLIWLGIQVFIIGYVSWMQPVTAIVAVFTIFLAYLLPNYAR
jgi:hypothetical protein